MANIDPLVRDLARRNFVDRLYPKNEKRCYECKYLQQLKSGSRRYTCAALDQPIPKPRESQCNLFEV